MQDKTKMSVMEELIAQMGQPHIAASAKLALQSLVKSQKDFQPSATQPSSLSGLPAIARALLCDLKSPSGLQKLP
jgi:hypothetical protein